MGKNNGKEIELHHDRLFWIMCAAVFAYVLGLYITTLAPTVTFWDAGEFISTSHILGIPHPPGTPLFVLIGKVWSLIPFPFTVPYKLNLLSAVSTSIAALLLFVAVAKVLWRLPLGKENGSVRWIVYGGAFAASIVSSTAITVWGNAVETEVYSIALLMIAILTLLAFQWRERRGTNEEKVILLLMAYIAGLSVGNHLMALLAGPGLLLFFLTSTKGTEFKYYLSLVLGLISLILLLFTGIDLDKFGMGKFLENFSLLFTDVIKWPPFVFSFILLIVAVYWMNRLKSLKVFGFLLAFFALGLSVHLYLPIRAVLDPSINEADPITWNAFWDVLLRKQYGTRPPFPRTVDFFEYQLPLYFIYFFQQYGHIYVTFLYILVGVLGIYAHSRLDRDSFWYFFTIYMATSVGLVFYLNFKLGHTQALTEFPNQDMHEVRERDYFFEVSFVFFGLWVGIGLAYIVNALRKFMTGAGESKVIFYSLSAFVFLLAFLPSKLNYFESDKSENYIAWDYAYDILISAEPYGVIFTNGDNDTFPLWFLQEVEGVRKDVMVANLSLINTPWYIKQLRDWVPPDPAELPKELVDLWKSQGVEIPSKPPDPIVSYTDEEIDALVPVQIGSDRVFRTGGLEVVYEKGRIFRVQDLMVLHLLRVNDWKRPMYFAVTVSGENKVDLNDYFLMQALLYRIMPVKVAELEKQDENIAYVPEANVYIDVARSDTLLNSVYSYRSIMDPKVYKDPNTRKLLNNYAAAYSFLGRAYISKSQIDKSIKCYELAREFAQNPERFDYLISTLYAQQGNYTMADSFLGRYMKNLDTKESRDPSLYLQRAALAFSEGDTQRAIDYLEESIVVDPSYRVGYHQLYRFYEALNRETEAQDVLRRLLERFPEDSMIVSQAEKHEENQE